MEYREEPRSVNVQRTSAESRTMTEPTALPSLTQARKELVDRFVELPNELKFTILRHTLYETPIIKIKFINKYTRSIPPNWKRSIPIHDRSLQNSRQTPLLQSILRKDTGVRKEFRKYSRQIASHLPEPIDFDPTLHIPYFDSYDAVCQFLRPQHYRQDLPVQQALTGSGMKTIFIRLTRGCGVPEGRDHGDHMLEMRQIFMEFIRKVRTLERITVIVDKEMAGPVRDRDWPDYTLLTPSDIKSLKDMRDEKGIFKRNGEQWYSIPATRRKDNPLAVFVTNVVESVKARKDIFDKMEALSGKKQVIPWNTPDIFCMTKGYFDRRYR
jgi:hypothetical protein